MLWKVFYKPCFLRIQRRQQEEEAEAERGTEEEEVNQSELLKRTSLLCQNLYNNDNFMLLQAHLFRVYFLTVHTATKEVTHV